MTMRYPLIFMLGKIKNKNIPDRKNLSFPHHQALVNAGTDDSDPSLAASSPSQSACEK